MYVLYGDTNSTIAGAWRRKIGIQWYNVEADLRKF